MRNSLLAIGSAREPNKARFLGYCSALRTIRSNTTSSILLHHREENFSAYKCVHFISFTRGDVLSFFLFSHLMLMRSMRRVSRRRWTPPICIVKNDWRYDRWFCFPASSSWSLKIIEKMRSKCPLQCHHFLHISSSSFFGVQCEVIVIHNLYIEVLYCK